MRLSIMMHRRLFMFLVVLLLPGLSHGFQPTFGFSVTHREITKKAILRKTAEVCRDLAAATRGIFTLTTEDTLSVNAVRRACFIKPLPTFPLIGSLLSSDDFQTAMNTIHKRNARVDRAFLFSPSHHFDDETFPAGRDIITTGLAIVKFNVKMGNFEAGRETLGDICHTLQDFYSHSDWVELGKRIPYSALISRDQPLENLAGINVPTCRSCDGDVCSDNILPAVIEHQLLTSGYFDVKSSVKPPGKCSHGGIFDRTSRRDPVGGINKDTRSSNHGFLHEQAADLAVDATLELLEDIRIAVGDRDFLRFMGLSRSSALCFVIDTTGSMTDDIAAVKDTSFRIIDSRRGTPEEPHVYILVPFSDPGFGPVLRTTDPDIFKASMNRLTARGGGDSPELSLSGLQLALTAAPPASDIFLFTDAPAKDAHLRNTITALIESTKSVVTFLLTSVLGAGRRRRRQQSDGENPLTQRVTQVETELYRDLARASGGQTIEVTKLEISQATAVIEDLSANAVVTVFQAAVDPGHPDSFSFLVEASTRNIVIYITGVPSLTFTLASPTGVSHNSTEPSGPLATYTTVGNLHRISLNSTDDAGLWKISVNSRSAYAVRVTGQSSVNFVFNIVEEREGAHSGLEFLDGRPPTGGNVTVLITVTGSDTATITNATLFDRSRTSQINGSVESLGGTNFLARFRGVPAGEFVMGVIGEESSSSSRTTPDRFQRQASTQIKTSSLSVTALANSSNIEPGSSLSFPFTVSSSENGTFSLQVSNDRGYALTAPSSVTITPPNGGVANGVVTISVPASADSGTDVTLTIEAQNAAATDINFAVLRFSVVASVTDISSPVCQTVRVSGTCPTASALCATTQWEFIANITDGLGGTGIVSVSLRQGNGSLNTSMEEGAGGEKVIEVTYVSSCCSKSVLLAAVDGVGNVGRCAGQAKSVATPAGNTTAKPTAEPNMSTAAHNSVRGSTLSLSCGLWIGIVVSLLWKHTWE